MYMGGLGAVLGTMIRRIEREEEEREREREREIERIGREQTCFPFRCRLDPSSYQLQDGPYRLTLDKVMGGGGPQKLVVEIVT